MVQNFSRQQGSQGNVGMRQPVGRAAGNGMGFIWQGRTLLRQPQQGAGLVKKIFTQPTCFIVKLIKAPPWTGGLLLPCPLQDIKVGMMSCSQ